MLAEYATLEMEKAVGLRTRSDEISRRIAELFHLLYKRYYNHGSLQRACWALLGKEIMKKGIDILIKGVPQKEMDLLDPACMKYIFLFLWDRSKDQDGNLIDLVTKRNWEELDQLLREIDLY